MSRLLEVGNLRIELTGRHAPVTIVDGIDFAVEAGEVFGIAGESGSGKTMTALSILGLLPTSMRATGEVVLDGRNLLHLAPASLRDVRGRQIAMVFQDPASSLHPMLSIEHQLTEHLRFHLGLGRDQARQRAFELLTEVRIPDPAAALHGYPHQFSGGMRQRIQIAMALACEPRLLIADEPTTALDVTVQAGILRLLDRLRREAGLAVILITHDLGVLSALADRMMVMYAGRIAETGGSAEVVRRARHPYTRGLIDSLPHPESADQPLLPIGGTPPDPADRPGGCAFHPRCAFVQDRCRAEVPPLIAIDAGRAMACPVDPFVSAPLQV